MLPKHGKIDCTDCFPEGSGNVFEPNSKWRIVNDPGAWGGNNEPEYLVLGFSKGFTQAGMCNNKKFEDIAFAGMRKRLTKALQSIGVLSDSEHVTEKIDNPDSQIAFGSLIRCSVSRKDEKSSKASKQNTYSCTGHLITKSFDEIPEIINNCTTKFLVGLPKSIKAVIFLSNSDKYVSNVQRILEELFPESFKRINPMCVECDGRKWLHIAHVSGLNGHFNTWLDSDSSSGLKRLQAISGLQGGKVQTNDTPKVITTTNDTESKKSIECENMSSITEIFALGTRGDAAGRRFVAKRDKNGKFVLNRKKSSTSATSTNLAVNKEYADSLDKAYELLATDQYLINLVCSQGSRALRKFRAVNIKRRS